MDPDPDPDVCEEAAAPGWSPGLVCGVELSSSPGGTCFFSDSAQPSPHFDSLSVQPGAMNPPHHHPHPTTPPPRENNPLHDSPDVQMQRGCVPSVVDADLIVLVCKTAASSARISTVSIVIPPLLPRLLIRILVLLDIKSGTRFLKTKKKKRQPAEIFCPDPVESCSQAV